MNSISPQATNKEFFITSHDQQHSIFSLTTLAPIVLETHNADHLVNTFKNTTISLLIGTVKLSVELS